MAQLKITLAKSTIGAIPKHKKTAIALGLTKTQKTVIQPDNAAIRGMIRSIEHLVKVEEIQDSGGAPMNLQDLKPAEGSKQRAFRVGRGHGSGNGKTAGRGHKGQKARSGGGVRPGFEGGQMPLYRRIPKRGFTNRNTKEIIAINVDRLNCFEDGTEVTVEALKTAGIIKNPKDGVKLLGNGDLTKKLNVKVNGYSQSAKEKIEAAGGTAELV